MSAWSDRRANRDRQLPDVPADMWRGTPDQWQAVLDPVIYEVGMEMRRMYFDDADTGVGRHWFTDAAVAVAAMQRMGVGPLLDEALREANGA